MTSRSTVSPAQTHISRMALGGYVGAKFSEYEKNWIQKSFQLNPGFWDAYERPQRYFDANVYCPWHSEFAGKMLVGAIDAYRVSGDPQTAEVIRSIIANLKKYQREDGYIGPHPVENSPCNADKWGMYLMIAGLCSWYEITAEEQLLEMAAKAAAYCYALECIDGKFASTETDPFNGSIVHGFALIYEKTQDPRFLEAAEYMVNTTWHISGSDWFCNALSGKEFAASTKNTRWENVHALLALGVLFRITKKAEYYTAMEQIYWSLLKTEVHNTGGFSTNEIICGDPYNQGIIETCCSTAWQAFSSDFLKLSKNSLVADELERMYLNAMLGSIVDGERVTYATNMSGSKRVRQWSQVTVSPEGLGADFTNLACCTCNGARSVSGISQWALLTDSDAVYLNYFGASAIEAKTPGGQKLVVTQITEYPINGQIDISLALEHSEAFAFYIRIPAWAGKNSALRINGEKISVTPGTYACVNRSWQSGDVIKISIEMTVHYLVGQSDCIALTSAYYGPILITFDSDLYSGNFYDCAFSLDAVEKLTVSRGPAPYWMLFHIQNKNGQTVQLTDFASAGHTGDFESWLNVEHCMLPLPGGKNEEFPWCNTQKSGKELLQALITFAGQYRETIYTPESFRPFSAALTQAKTVYEDASSDGISVQIAAETLHRRIADLVKDYSSLMTTKMPVSTTLSLENVAVTGKTVWQSEEGIVLTSDSSTQWSIEDFPAVTYKEKVGLNGLTVEYTVNSFSGTQTEPYVAIFLTENCGASAWNVTEHSGNGYMLILPISTSEDVVARISMLKVGENYRPVYTAAAPSPYTAVGNKITVHLEQHPTAGYQIFINGALMENAQPNLPLVLADLLQNFGDAKAYVSLALVLGEKISPAQVTLNSISVR